MNVKHATKLANCVICPVCHARHVPDHVFAANCGSCGHFLKFRVKSDVNSQITFTVNGQEYTVGNEYPPWTSLNTYLRKERISVGTKVMCREGGCGICLVQAKLYEAISDTNKSYAINSCLCPLFMCDGWEITTIEGVDKLIPERLAKYNGSQCGFCSPAQVMNMHALLDFNKGTVSMKQVEEAYDDVICRCTGYRPILDAMKSFAKDSPAVTKTCSTDIEDLDRKFCQKTGQLCHGKCHPKEGEQLQVVGSDAVWNRPTTVDQLLKIMSDNPEKKIRIVFGNTGSGVFQELSTCNFDILIDIRGIKDIYVIDFDDTVILGAGLSITQLIDIFFRTKLEPSFDYFIQMRNMLQRVATTSIRSLGSWAGNIMLKHLHQEFQSDIYVTLEAANAQLLIADHTGTNPIPISQFLKTDMTDKVILAMTLSSMEDYVIRMYKVAQRAENSHSYVNAGIRMKIDKKNNFMVKEKPCVVLSGISKDFVHAVETETYLEGKSLSDVSVIQEALKTLSSELNPDPNLDPVEPSVGYRKTVALGFLYTYILEVLGDKVSAPYRSGALPLSRPLSSGQQSYDTKPMEWPLTEPLMKLEALNQTSGRAEYINDIPEQQQELHAAFVISTVGNAKIGSMDPSKALSMPGVLKFITAKDIPGQNNCYPAAIMVEEALCSGEVMYAGQALGIIVAVDEETANRAACEVQVTYTDQKPPVLSIEDGIKQGSYFPNPGDEVKKGDAKTAISNSPKQITGSIYCGHQQHFQMETQIAICRPTEDGMDVEASTQWLDLTQLSTATVLGVPENSVNVKVKRLGGAYGSKISRNFIVSAGCAIAAHVMERPMRLNMEFHTNMKMSGRRFAYRADYTIGCSDEGKLNGIMITLYGDMGYLPNDSALTGTFTWIDNAYYCPNWDLVPKAVKTNKPMNTYCRGPGSTPGIFIMESIMEHVAKELNMDPTAFRILNLYNQGQSTPMGNILKYCNIRQIVSDFMKSSEITDRWTVIQAFNKANRWKKKGLSVVPIKYGVSYGGVHYNAIVNIFAADGSISIAHGGVESGQGINTKVAQVCAFELGVPMSLIKVKANTSLANANCYTTGGSITSEMCCLAVVNCCNDLKKRMAPVKAKMQNPSWRELTERCIQEKVDISSRYCVFQPGTDDPNYNTYGVTCTEVEMDVLTGQHLINRVDILYDCGESMNPAIDVGQVEGAFVMGLGYYLTEQVKFETTTGQLLTKSTWEYKPPMAKDIPIDFRIALLKNAPNPAGVLRSKAVGEPPLCMSCSALFALKHCVEAVRKDIQKDTFFRLDCPASVDRLQELCLVDSTQFII